VDLSAAPTDRELWQKSIEGDDRAFAAIYDRYAPRLLAYAVRRTRSRARAEDAVSLVMLETWRRRYDIRFSEDDSLAGWLFRTARYVLANEARAARHHRDALARIASRATQSSEYIASHLVDDERLRLAVDGLAQLSDRDREVIELAAVGLTESEMAAALGVAVGTIKSRLSRARRRLAERFEVHQQLFTVTARTTSTEVQP
jgi:RNA polymerase sigma-70 factor (ECF subfamily)